jgi:hypothetical protein
MGNICGGKQDDDSKVKTTADKKVTVSTGNKGPKSSSDKSAAHHDKDFNESRDRTASMILGGHKHDEVVHSLRPSRYVKRTVHHTEGNSE